MQLEIPKIKNLQVGQVIKNYKELCGLLGIKINTGKAKQIQLEKLNNFIKYHKEGNKFIIDEVKDADITCLMDKRILGNNSVTSIEIGDIIIHKLLTEYKGKQLTITNNELLYRLTLVSKEFKDFIYNLDTFRIDTGINYSYLRDYKLKLGKQLNNRIESALKRLKSGGYIYYTQKIHLSFINEKGVVYSKPLDTNEDIQLLLDAKNDAFEYINAMRADAGKTEIKDMGTLILYNDYKCFRERVCEILSYNLGETCINFWEGYVINTTQKSLERLIDNDKLTKNIEYVKENFYNLLEHTSKNIRQKEIERLQILQKENYEKEMEKIMWGEPLLLENMNIDNEIKKIIELSRILIG